ncbi:MAG TPA: hypothetical protein VFK43_13950, partial [Acidimicrobiales bacterium]|nr:hypothetical protein [Acidimicrobiales bacterium]
MEGPPEEGVELGDWRHHVDRGVAQAPIEALVGPFAEPTQYRGRQFCGLQLPQALGANPGVVGLIRHDGGQSAGALTGEHRANGPGGGGADFGRWPTENPGHGHPLEVEVAGVKGNVGRLTDGDGVVTVQEVADEVTLTRDEEQADRRRTDLCDRGEAAQKGAHPVNIDVGGEGPHVRMAVAVRASVGGGDEL